MRRNFSRGMADDKPQKLNVRGAFANMIKAFGLVYRAYPTVAVGMGVITLISAFIPAAQAYAGKLIVDGVVNALRAGLPVETSLRQVLPFLAIEFVLITLSAVLSQMRTLLEHMLHARLSYTINTTIIRKALSLDLQFFEDSQFYDQLQNARREADRRMLQIMITSYSVVQGVLTLASFAVLLLAFNPLIALVLFGAVLPAFIAQNKFSELNFRLLTWRAPESRRMNYYEQLLTGDESVKEIKLFGLGEPLLKRYMDLFWKFNEEDTVLAKRRSWISLGFGLLSSLAYYGAYGWIVFRAVGGSITLGDMTLYLSLFRQSQSSFQGLLYNLNSLYESALFMSNLFGFLELTPAVPAALNPKPVPSPIKQGIEFRHVSFKYPNRDGFALEDVSLFIHPGEKLALVGANGAGKTTFIKLLTRLYDPTSGQILLDGIDLRDFDLEQLRDKIGVIFQDFVQYNATAKENIGFGQIKALDDQPRIERAAEKGGADDVINTLSEKYDTMLGHWFEKGNGLSGGQWQKMALARAFMREAEVLVLDEPTSALDAEREYEIFQRFRELTAGRIAILISHRFSTVRMADRILVLDQGKMVELGTHPELLALEGRYARLFNMQAEGYR